MGLPEINLALPEINLEIVAYERVLNHWLEYFENEYDENHEVLEYCIKEMHEKLGDLYVAQHKSIEEAEVIDGDQ